MREFVVVGPAQSGKSTFGALLAIELGTESTDTSEVLVEVETKRQAVLAERYKLEARLTCHKARPEMDGDWVGSWDVSRGRPVRELLVALGDAFVEVLGLDFLARRCLDKGQVCVGVRRKLELRELRKSRPDLTVIWIVRPGYEADGLDNLDITADDCEVTISNHGTKEDLARQAAAVANMATPRSA